MEDCQDQLLLISAFSSTNSLLRNRVVTVFIKNRHTIVPLLFLVKCNRRVLLLCKKRPY